MAIHTKRGLCEKCGWVHGTNIKCSHYELPVQMLDYPPKRKLNRRILLVATAGMAVAAIAFWVLL